MGKRRIRTRHLGIKKYIRHFRRKRGLSYIRRKGCSKGTGRERYKADQEQQNNHNRNDVVPRASHIHLCLCSFGNGNGNALVATADIYV